MNDRKLLNETTSEIRSFFGGRSKGIGFVGAMFLEKLFYAYPEIATIYLLISPKRLADVHHRVGTLFES
jgi:hypothetical protein